MDSQISKMDSQISKMDSQISKMDSQIRNNLGSQIKANNSLINKKQKWQLIRYAKFLLICWVLKFKNKFTYAKQTIL
jgi:TolA-binding protein